MISDVSFKRITKLRGGLVCLRPLCGALLLTILACSKESPPQKKFERQRKVVRVAPTSTATPSSMPTLPLESAAFTDEEALGFLKEQCASCHSKGKDYSSFWSFSPDKLSAEDFGLDAASYRVYQTLWQRAQGKEQGAIASMPPNAADAKTKEDSLRFVRWADATFPDLNLQAHAHFGTGAIQPQAVKVLQNFQCSSPVTFRQYIRRVTNDAFNREPTPAELKLAGTNPDVKVDAQIRSSIVQRFSSDAVWKEGLENVTLRKLTDKVGGTKDIRDFEGFYDADQVSDLRNEFYQLVLSNLHKQSWKEILLADKVMVTSKTAPLYGCTFKTGPSDPLWQECALTAPRGSFFTSIGYLTSKPSSFLEINNNYGRTAVMNMVITGEVLSAATDGPKGNAEIKPLPACLKTKDFRGVKSGANIAPFGTSKIPQSGNVCQSCHISRHMAAGSLLFRPFLASGKIVDAPLLLKFKTPVADAKPEVDSHSLEALKDALSENIVNQPELGGAVQPVSLSFLQSLLIQNDGTEQACLPAQSGLEQDLTLTSVKDLAAHLTRNDPEVARGLARHVPISLSNLSVTTGESVGKIMQAYNESGGKIVPVISAYFGTETYACEKVE